MALQSRWRIALAGVYWPPYRGDRVAVASEAGANCWVRASQSFVRCLKHCRRLAMIARPNPRRYTRRVNITRNDFNWIGDSAMAAFGYTSDCLYANCSVKLPAKVGPDGRGGEQPRQT